jgi:hypothetical protein
MVVAANETSIMPPQSSAEELGSEESTRNATVSDAPSVTTESAPSRHAVATVSRLERPYFSFRLEHRSLPPLFPPRLEVRNITLQDWERFWFKMKPLVRQCERFAQFDLLSSPILCGISTFIFQALAVVVFLPVAIYCRYKRQELVRSIEALCNDSDEVSVFLANGLTLECAQVPSEILGVRMQLYMLPVDQPYVRFEVYNGHALTGPEWSSQALSQLDVSLPPELESVPHSDWNEFWSRMKQLYEPQRRLAATTLAAPAVAVAIVILSMGSPLVFVPAVFGLVIFAIYNHFCYVAFLTAKVELAHEFVMDCSRLGIHMEHRRLMHLNAWFLLLERHFIYVYPSVQSNNLESSNAVRSTESIGAVRSRHRLPSPTTDGSVV